MDLLLASSYYYLITMLNCDFYYSCCQIRGYPKPARNPTGAGAGVEMNPRVCLRTGFAQPRGFAYGRVFAKPAPASAGAIPTSPAPEEEHGKFLSKKKRTRQRGGGPSQTSSR